MKYLIINADDFGMSEGINDGIVECFRAGVVTNAGLIVNMEASAHAASLGREVGLPLGLHVNLFSSHGRERFGPAEELRDILRQREQHGRDDVDVRDEDIPLILEELDRQVRAFVALVGREPNHLSYHFGLHFLPKVHDAFIRFAKDRRIPFRLGFQYGPANHDCASCRHPNRWIDDFHGRDLTVEHFLRCLERAGEGITEISVHPGYATGSEDDADGTDRENELRILLSDTVRSRLRRDDLVLVDYSLLSALP